MKNGKKIIAGAVAAALTLSMGSMFVGCGAGECIFQAEDATITDGIVTSYDQSGKPSTAPGKVTVEMGYEYTEDGSDGDEVCNVGYFCGDGTKLTWTITSSKDCKATFYVRAASAVDMMSAWSGGPLFPDYDLADNKYFKLVVNDEDVELKGTIAGMDGIGFEQMANPALYRNFTLSEGVVINLKKGENVISLVSTNPSGGANIDYIKLDADAKLTFTPTDNSDREVQM